MSAATDIASLKTRCTNPEILPALRDGALVKE